MDKPSLQLIGGVILSTPAVPDGVALGKKAQGLLAYLALNNAKACTREHLAVLFWPDRQDEQARQSLRQAISSLRKALGPAAADILISDSNGVRIDPAHLDVDVLTFNKRLKDGTRDTIVSAMEDYHGDFMEQVASLSDGFDTWRDAERYTMRVHVAEALDTLTATNDPWLGTERAAAIAKIIADRDLLSEPAHRALIRYYGRTGQFALAHRQYQFCKELLNRELGLDPDPDTLAVLKDATAQSSNPPTPPPATEPPPDTDESLPDLAPPVSAPAHADTTVPPMRDRNPTMMGLGATLILFALLGSGAFWVLAGKTSQPEGRSASAAALSQEQPSSKSIGILPFRIVGEDPRVEDLMIGLHVGLTTAMSMISDLKVISSSTMQRYQGTDFDADRIASEVNVRYVLEGSLQLNGTLATIGASLLDTETGQTVWSKLYEREAREIVPVQKEITRELLKELQVELVEGEQARIPSISDTENLEAWLLASKALQATRRLNPSDLNTARTHYREALRLDPDYSGATVGLAWTHVVEIMLGTSASRLDSLSYIKQTAAYLKDHESGVAARHSLLAFVALFEGHHAKAADLAQKSIRQMPASADFHALGALIMTYTGDYDRAANLIRRAIELSPMHHDWYVWTLGRTQRLSGRADAALQSLKGANKANCSCPIYCLELTATLAALGRVEDAKNHAGAIKNAIPTFSVSGYLATPAHKEKSVEARERLLLTQAGLPE